MKVVYIRCRTREYLFPNLSGLLDHFVPSFAA
jgi:hypothetical protein